MAKLKLMKKEWFDWFKNTTLDNITAWTEYYYINPDSQHWISNYQLWDGVLEQGSIDNDTGEPIFSSRQYRSKNFIPVLPLTYYYKWTNESYNYIFFYDANKNFISRYESSSEGIFETPSNCYFIKFRTGNLADVDAFKAIINKSNTTFNGHYEPRIIKIEDILEVVNLGDLTWVKNGDLGYYSTDISDDVKLNTRHLFCTKYEAEQTATTWVPNKIGVNNTGILWIGDSSVPTTEDFTQYVTGVYLIFIKRDSPLG